VVYQTEPTTSCQYINKAEVEGM